MPKLWTTKQLAEKAGTSAGYIRQLLIAGKMLKGYKLAGGRDWLVEDKVARKWLRKRNQK